MGLRAFLDPAFMTEITTALPHFMMVRAFLSLQSALALGMMVRAGLTLKPAKDDAAVPRSHPRPVGSRDRASACVVRVTVLKTKVQEATGEPRSPHER